MQHVLELVMQLKTGQVTSGLDKVESQINKVIESLTKFSQSVGPATLINPQNVVVVDEINEALKATERYTGLVTDRNVEAVVANLEYLETATATGEALRAQGQEVQNLSAAEVRRARINDRLEGYINNIDELIVHQGDLMTGIMNDAVAWDKVTGDQVKDVKEMVKHFESIEKAGKSIEDEFGITKEHFDKMKDFTKEMEDNFGKSVSHAGELKSLMSDLVMLVPGLEKFAMLATPIKLLGNEMLALNKLYEDNHTVNKLLISDLQQTDDLFEGLSETAINAKHSGVLYGEAMDSVTAILNTGQARIIQTAEEMENLTNAVASTSRATGVENSALASLSLRLKGLTGDLKSSNKLMDTMVNVQHDSGMTTAQMSKVSQLLSNDLARLNKAYAVYNDRGEQVASGSQAIVAVMGEIAKAAQNAGADVDSAMQLMTMSIEDPMKAAPLLQGAFNADSILEQQIEMGKNAERFLSQMEGMKPAQQQIMAQALGFTVKQLKAATSISAKYEPMLEGLNTQAERSAKIKEIEIQMNKDAADAADAKLAKDKALATAVRQMADAWDQIRIIFGEIAAALQPVLKGFAWLLKIPFVPQILAYTSVLLGLLIAAKKIGMALPFVSKMFKKTGQDIGSAAKQGTGKGLQSFAENIKNFINTLGKVDMKRALKAAGTIALVGGALAVGVYAIAKAASALPPDKAAELGVTLAGIVAATYIIKQVPQDAIKGALVIALVGSALAIGIAAIGHAATLLPEDKAAQLMIVLSSVLIGTALLIPIGNIGAQALLGAVMLLAVGAALAASLALIGLAMMLMPPDQLTNFIVITSLLLVATGILAAIGILAAATAGAPLLGALMLLAVGAALAASLAMIALAMKLFSEDMIDMASGLLMLAVSLAGLVIALAGIGVFAPIALIGAMLLVPIAIALSFSLPLMAAALGNIDPKIAMAGAALGAAMAGLAVVGAFAPIALVGAVALTPIAAALYYGIPLISAAAKKIDPKMVKMGALLGEMMSNLAIMGVFAPSALIGAFALLAIALPLKAAAWMLKGLGAGHMEGIADGISYIAKAMQMVPSKGGAALASLAAGLTAFSLAMAGGAILSFFSGGTVQNAEEMAEALDTLVEPVKSISDVGPEAGDTFKNIGVGLREMSGALSQGGGISSLFTGNVATNAIKLSAAIKELSGPIALISRFGPDAAQSFNVMTTGVSRLAGVINRGIGLDEAKELADSLREISYPMSEILDAQTAKGKAFAQGLSEELKTGLSVDIRRENPSEEESVIILKEIRDAIIEESPKRAETVEKLAAILEKLNVGTSAAGKDFSNVGMSDNNWAT